MPNLALNPAEINDLIRFSRVSMRVVLLGSLTQSPNKDAIVEAAHSYEFQPNDDSDHAYATFKLEGRSYFFQIERDESPPTVSDDGLPEDGRVITIGLES